MSAFGSFEEFSAAMDRRYDQQIKFDQQLRELGAYVRETAEQIRLTNEQMQQTDARLDQLVATVRSHELRIERLEGEAG